MTEDEYAKFYGIIMDLQHFAMTVKPREKISPPFLVITKHTTQAEIELHKMRSEEYRKTLQKGVKIEEKHAGEQKQRAFYFTKKEIEEMPTLKDCHIRRKPNGTFEVRYRRLGFEKSFSSKVLKEAKARCYAWLKTLNIDLKERDVKPEEKKYTRFIDFADNYMETVKQPNVTPGAYRSYKSKYDNYIKVMYKNATFNELTPIQLQKDLSQLRESSGRTYEDVRVLLNGIFKYAMANGIIDRNPLDAVFIAPHERTTGQALTLDAERRFVECIKGTDYEGIMLLLLYTGCRPCEYESFTYDEKTDTITLANGKLKHYQKIKTRTMPVFPLLRPHLEKVLNIKIKYDVKELNYRLKKILPKYTLKDLRHTFATRAKECGCNPEVVNLWQAHALGNNMTANVYTHYTIEFQKKEAEKLIYYYK